ncbi:conserved Plasmodium protein, unknown function [Plasmodium berghei]|uniref:SprT-like domain-containing protein, putative n=2 Tax=Plasmodium berghei TaxID=5821 RepID=A0A509APE8_PLABA|nr:SprT-like domain-containing protein, putative [Plasmodium berghei ANKA]CXJ02120.1 conserved Plasmodium protein, unknown function [Plasmodium berghei]SCL98268.1 conserved Plasmodium protein, unknown function [Plasmodium berghei]SCM16794.1 conserved Plasmodium protein, unknown function [Plasmodium berghei]SCM18592.1 conserved Plasmodium protein, unknown function [Plasmodium berghei]SCN28027.1 conserved Plasmodium protein, unknown function [Plasmodium berghei]|eukprot:XP_034423678.1 SprT-like domain-containing protein, putative [Plasmodium berghei ANKA]
MYNEINKLTSVENEYLEKSGKKRRQKNRSFYLISNENDNKYFTQIVDNSIFSNERDNAVKNSNQNNIESDYKKDVQEHDEDLSTLEVIRQLSSIKIDSSTDSSNAKDSYARNRIREKKKEKKNEKKKKIIIHHIPSIECVEDIVVYDESKDTEFPDLYELFSEYNVKYFYNRLESVQVKWSNKMKLCAGICIFKKSGYCCIRLSLPLLKLRKIKEYKETLLHEMIHAFLFLNQKKTDKNDGHGPEFKKHMYRINKLTGLNISIYHSFHDEVHFYRNHVWRCTGICRKYPPHFGYIKRSMNRPPGPKEKWWRSHSTYCSGKFVKIKELEPSKNVEGNGNKHPPDLNTTLEEEIELPKKTNGKKIDDNRTNGAMEIEDVMDDFMFNDTIIITDSNKKKSKKKTDTCNNELDIINIIKTLFNNNKESNIHNFSTSDNAIDYHKAFKSKNYFEID